MEHAIEVEQDGRSFVVTTSGQGSAEGIIAFLDAIVSHPSWQPGHHILLDHRKLNIADITVKGIDRVSHHFQKIAPQLGGGKIALVMKKDIDFGIARAWELTTDEHVDIQIGVYRSMDEARMWLRQ
jgi:hypothetical protein